MEEVKAYLSLGSNLGRRETNLEAAIGQLSQSSNIESGCTKYGRTQSKTELALNILRLSSVYETAPWGLEDQPDFLNCVLEVETHLTPSAVLELAKRVEDFLGRKPGTRYGPRLIDVDILFYGKLVLEQPDLQIPHPRLHLRAFALVPLAELVPEFIHPVLNVSVAQLAREVDDREGVKTWGPPPSIINAEYSSRQRDTRRNDTGVQEPGSNPVP